MPELRALTLAYMRAHPAEAAQTLDAATGLQVAELLHETPARIAAPVLAEVAPSRAAECLLLLPEARTVELLSQLGTQASIQILRHVSEAQQVQLLDGLPTAAALAIRLLLGYPRDVVGAIAEPAVVVALPHTPVGDALRQVRALEGTAAQVVVLDERRRLRGWITLDALLRAAEGVPLGGLATVPPGHLPATMPLAGALASPLWSRTSVLPVLDRAGRLVGLLSRDALTRAAERESARARAQRGHADSLGGVLAEIWFLNVISLLRASLSWLPPVRPLESQGNGQ